ncbi:MAG: hypothetical protein LBR23_05230 [Spirochaetaceae bacterium]|nr:hypothetical protein [Spirochaetaceae bacterium]
MTAGLETGYDFATVGIGSDFAASGKSDAALGLIPIFLRIGYHPDLGIKNLDIYALGKAGYAIGFWTGDITDSKTITLSNPMGFAFGFDLGARYFFTRNLGVFVEVGFERYVLPYDMTMDLDIFGKYTSTVDAFGAKFATAGLTFKL